MKIRDAINIVEAAEGAQDALQAVQIAASNPITRKPVFRILGADGTDHGTIMIAATAEEALTVFRNKRAKQDQATSEPVPSIATPPETPRAPRPKRLPIRRVPFEGFSSIDEDDGYLYHVTTVSNARAILAGGFLADAPRMMSNYGAHSAARVFFTERAGVSYWAERVEAHAFHNTGREIRPAVLRVPREALADRLIVDPVGTRDARAAAYFIEGAWTP